VKRTTSAFVTGKRGPLSRNVSVKRALWLVLLCCVCGIDALGQIQNPWGCQNPKNNDLICFVPVATRSIGSQNSPAPAFNSSFATQLSQLPLLSSASGVVLTLDRTLGVYVLAGESLGPILTERAQTIGRHRLLLAFAYQHFHFTDIDGTSLSAAPFVFTYPSGTGGTVYTAQTQNISMSLNQYVALATFGLTTKTDVSVILPFGDVSIGSNAAVTLYSVTAAGNPQGNPASFNNPHLGGSASGISDMLINLKSILWSGEKTKFSGGILFRFPTGDALNYLGSGAYGFNPYAILSYQARLSPHLRLGYQFNTTTVLLPTKYDAEGNAIAHAGLPGGLQYDFGADYVLFKKVPTTIAADFLGNFVVNSPVLNLLPYSSQTLGPQLASAYPSTANLKALIAPTNEVGNPVYNYSYNLAQLSIGAKVKPWRNLVLYGNVLFQLNNVGLRSNPVPLVGASFTF